MSIFIHLWPNIIMKGHIFVHLAFKDVGDEAEVNHDPTKSNFNKNLNEKEQPEILQIFESTWDVVDVIILFGELIFV